MYTDRAVLNTTDIKGIWLPKKLECRNRIQNSLDLTPGITIFSSRIKRSKNVPSTYTHSVKFRLLRLLGLLEDPFQVFYAAFLLAENARVSQE